MTQFDDAPLAAGRDLAASCGQCLFETIEAESNVPSFERLALDSTYWAAWQQELQDLVDLLVDGPIRVLILHASEGRYLQMQVGHGRCVMEVSRSATSSRRGLSGDSIARVLIDGGFMPPAGFFGRIFGSPNWSNDLEMVEAAALTEIVVGMLRDLMQVECHEVVADLFVVDRPCAACHWGH
ncbi:MAG: hypothetical protein AB8G26_13600 [Ilumatobacter sp.]